MPLLPLLQTEFAEAPSRLVSAKKRGRAGTEKFTDAKKRSANNNLGYAGRIPALPLPLIFGGFVHIHTAPHAHARSTGETRHCYTFGNTFGVCSHVLPDLSKGHGGMGYVRDTAVERMARDARVQAIGGGATEVMLEEVAKRM